MTLSLLVLEANSPDHHSRYQSEETIRLAQWLAVTVLCLEGSMPALKKLYLYGLQIDIPSLTFYVCKIKINEPTILEKS